MPRSWKKLLKLLKLTWSRLLLSKFVYTCEIERFHINFILASVRLICVLNNLARRLLRLNKKLLYGTRRMLIWKPSIKLPRLKWTSWMVKWKACKYIIHIFFHQDFFKDISIKTLYKTWLFDKNYKVFPLFFTLRFLSILCVVTRNYFYLLIFIICTKRRLVWGFIGQHEHQDQVHFQQGQLE